MLNREWVIDSHRGAFKEGLLENTVEAYIQSWKEGANCLECDIHQTKDGKIVLIHNRTIDHIVKFATKVPSMEEFHEEPVGNIKDHSIAFLKALKYPHNAELITLAEFLQLLKKLHIGAQIELKEGGYESKIAQIIADAKIEYDSLLGPLVCSSFNWLAVLKLQKAAKKANIPLYIPKKTTGLAFGFQGIPLGSWFGTLVLDQCRKKQIWGFMTYYKYLPISRIDCAHQKGVKFCPRVPDDIDLINRYIDANVDGFETDNVPLIRDCIIKKGYDLWPLPN